MRLRLVRSMMTFLLSPIARDAMHDAPPVSRAARLLVTALLVGLGLALLVFALSDWRLTDASAYWDAAQRVRAGEQLYPLMADVEAPNVYRYAPWFAWLGVPFTFLPGILAGALWSVILVTASIVAVIPLFQRGALAVGFFFLAVLIGISAIGNVQPLLVAGLVWGVERRSGPLWIAVAASLKAFPLLFALVYLGRREWLRAALAGLLTVGLVAPMLLYDLSGYTTDPGVATALARWPPAYVAAVAALAAVTLLVARRRYGWLAAAATVGVAMPRLFVYDITFVQVGAPAGRERVITGKAEMNGWSRRTTLAGVFVITFVMIQLAIPILALAQPRPARFGWQMYTALSSLPELKLESADGAITPVDLSDVVARDRAEIDFSPALTEHLCETTNAVAVRIGSGENERRAPCP